MKKYLLLINLLLSVLSTSISLYTYAESKTAFFRSLRSECLNHVSGNSLPIIQQHQQLSELLSMNHSHQLALSSRTSIVSKFSELTASLQDQSIQNIFKDQAQGLLLRKNIKTLLEQIKADGDQLRSWFFLFSSSHLMPEEFDTFIKHVGQAIDLINFGKNKRALKKILSLFSDSPFLSDLERYLNLNSVNLVTKDQLDEFTSSLSREFLEILSAETVSVYDLHRIKKYLRFIRVNLVVSESNQDLIDALFSLENKIAEINKDVNLAKYNGGPGLKDTFVVLKNRLKRRLNLIFQYFS